MPSEEREMTSGRTARLTQLAVAGVLTLWAAPVAAQRSADVDEGTQAEIQSELRAFYFSLAHHDWAALSEDILPAKMAAHHPVPDSLLSAARLRVTVTASAPGSGDGTGCRSGAMLRVDQARITIWGEWAEVLVPDCETNDGIENEFRFIHFEGRWRIVYINLQRG
jgi:hypothetical protein